jgi:branched-chain amino acid transport system substrate-binding protein
MELQPSSGTATVRRRRSRGRVAVLALVVVALVAAACGSDKKNSTSSGTTATTAAGGTATTGAAPTKSEIKIGMISSQTGTGGSSQKYAATTAAAWAKWVNAEKGGINGHPVNIIIKDDKSDGPTSLQLAKDFVENEKVAWILSADATADAGASPYLAQHPEIAVTGYGYLPTAWTKLPNYFTINAVAPFVNYLSVVGARAVKAKGFGGIVCAEVGTCSSGEPFYKELTTKFGIKYNGLLKVSSVAPSYTAECLKTIQDGTDYAQITLASAAAKKVMTECVKQGYKGYFGLAGGSSSEDAYKDVATAKLAGGLFAFPWWADAKPVAEFRAAEEKYNTDLWHESNSTAIWAALELTRKALANVPDTVTPQTVVDALYNVKNENLDGLLAKPVTYTKGAGQPNVNCVFLYQRDEAGKYNTVTDGPSGNGESGDLQSSCYTP